jgi:prevent-host-death family protein
MPATNVKRPTNSQPIGRPYSARDATEATPGSSRGSTMRRGIASAAAFRNSGWARFSELVRRVRERGERITITYHGEPVAEIRPIEPTEGDGWAARLQELEQRGALLRREPSAGSLQSTSPHPGALQRFLQERGE